MFNHIRAWIAKFLLPDKQFYIVGGGLHSVLHPIITETSKGEEIGSEDYNEKRDGRESIY